MIALTLSAVFSYAYDDAVCRIVRVIDGDTIVCDIIGWPDIVGKNISIRMKNCDAPEMRTTDFEEKKMGIAARDKLSEALTDYETVTLKNISKGKYFRIVADIHTDEKKLTCSGRIPPLTNVSYTCGGKTKCAQMTSCAEAYYYLNVCGLKRLDRDKDGIPCESICN